MTASYRATQSTYPHLLVTTQQLTLSRQEQGFTTAHLLHLLQQFITAYKTALHPHTPMNIHHLHQKLSSHPDQAFVTQFIHYLEYHCAILYSGP